MQSVWSALRSGIAVATLWTLLPLSAAAQNRESGAVYGAQSDAQSQSLLLDAVRAFRAEQYEEALTIFRRVESEHRRSDIGFYLGMVLHKLGRHAEALVAFRSAQRAGLREPIVDYYRAVSCYRLEMYERARASFRSLLRSNAAHDGEPLGPRLQQGVERFLLAIDREVPSDPASTLVASRKQRLVQVLQSVDSVSAQPAAQEWLEEAALLMQELPERERAGAQARFRASLLRAQEAARGADAPVRVAELESLLRSDRTVAR